MTRATAHIDALAAYCQDNPADSDALARLLDKMHAFVLKEVKQAGILRRDMDDAIQDGRLGIIRCLPRWDRTRAGFAAYGGRAAHYGIAMGKQRRSRWGRSAERCMREVTKAVACLTARLGREPSDYEVAQELSGMDRPNRERRLTVLATRRMDRPFEDVAVEDVTSEWPDPVDEAVTAERLERMRVALAELPERERRVIELRYGGLTLEGAGAALGITKERVRQIQKATLAKLREMIEPEMVA